MVKCCICGKGFVDKHPERPTPKNMKTCSRDCYYTRLRRDGHWNSGMKWEDIYRNKATLVKMKSRVKKKGKKHFNYDRKRTDTLLRNLTNNPMRSEKKNRKIQKEIESAPKETLERLLKTMVQDKWNLYQKKAFKRYGRKCMVCGKVTGQIDVHHKDGNRKNNELKNLMVLCPKHHREIHGRK